jgi:hypothetical protein
MWSCYLLILFVEIARTSATDLATGEDDESRDEEHYDWRCSDVNSSLPSDWECSSGFCMQVNIVHTSAAVCCPYGSDCRMVPALSCDTTDATWDWGDVGWCQWVWRSMRRSRRILLSTRLLMLRIPRRQQCGLRILCTATPWEPELHSIAGTHANWHLRAILYAVFK